MHRAVCGGEHFRAPGLYQPDLTPQILTSHLATRAGAAYLSGRIDQAVTLPEMVRERLLAA